MLLLNACSLGITEYCGASMTSYTLGNTYLYQITLLFKYSELMLVFTNNNLIGLIILGLSALTALYNVVRGSYRL